MDRELLLNDVRIFNEKFDEYRFASLNLPYPDGIRFSPTLTPGIPYISFKIDDIARKLAERFDDDGTFRAVCYKLIDLKMVYGFLSAFSFPQPFGPALIVGNNELHKLNPATTHLLRTNHHRVYLISVLVETFLDLLQLLSLGEIKDYAKNKWQRVFASLKLEDKLVFEDSEFDDLVAFKNRFRTAELHKFSSVRAFTSKQEWNHFQMEEQIVVRILSRFAQRFGAMQNLLG